MIIRVCFKVSSKGFQYSIQIGYTVEPGKWFKRVEIVTSKACSTFCCEFTVMYCESG